MKHTIQTLLSIFLPAAIIVGSIFILTPQEAKAENTYNEPFMAIQYEYIDRVKVLEKFFNKYNSPLEEHAGTFVKVADKYGFDYRLLPAISCMESTCAKRYIPETYNPFGWGGGHIDFDSFDEAIERVGKGLNDIYFAKGRDTVEKIAPVYTPPNHRNWAKGVNFFMQQMSTISETSSDA